MRTTPNAADFTLQNQLHLGSFSHPITIPALDSYTPGPATLDSDTLVSDILDSDILDSDTLDSETLTVDSNTKQPNNKTSHSNSIEELDI